MNCINYDGREVVITVDWQEGAYTRGRIREPLAHRHEYVSVWGKTVLVPCVIKVLRAWTKEQLPIYDFVRVEAHVLADGSAVVRWPMAHAGTDLRVDMRNGVCSTVELEGLEPERVSRPVPALPAAKMPEPRQRKQQVVGQLSLLEQAEDAAGWRAVEGYE